jgi:MFS family permease
MKKIIRKVNHYIYYGWIIIIVSGIALFMSSPGQTYSISVFIKAYQEEFRYSSTLISSAYSMATVASGLLLIFMGRAIDKYGIRKMMFIVGSLLALTAFYNSFVSNIVMISFGFFALRYFGQGSMTLLPNALVPQWFQKHRALAISLAGVGGLLATLIVPSFNLWMISEFGWQMAWRIWSLILVIFFLPLVVLFVGNQPEDYGLHVESTVPDESIDVHDALESVRKESFTLSEALKTKSFWFAGIISMLPSMLTTGLTFHFFTMMSLRSVSEQQSAFIIGLVAFPAFFIPFIARPLIDKYPVRNVLLLTVFMMIISIIFLIFNVTSYQTAIIFILFYGLSTAIQNVTIGVLWPNYFGRANLGSIRSVATVFMVIGSALGPMPFGISYDLTGDYNYAIIGILGFAIVAFILSFFVSKPIKQT